jgi:Protein tyrosine and serine/threonine kinase
MISQRTPASNRNCPSLTGKCGTLRYMSVEVASHLPYNVASDIYSWAMVCYEVMTLQKPFAGWTRDMHASLVCGRGARPDARAVPACIRPLMEVSWSQLPSLRPTAQVVYQKMRVLEEQEVLTIQAQQCHDEYLVASSPASAPPSMNHQLFTYAPPVTPPPPVNDGGNMVVELPQDFTIFRKPPGRNHSTYTTSTAVSLSTSGTDSYHD